MAGGVRELVTIGSIASATDDAFAFGSAVIGARAARRPGFVRRTLGRRQDGGYVDVRVRKGLASAQASNDRFMEDLDDDPGVA